MQLRPEVLQAEHGGGSAALAGAAIAPTAPAPNVSAPSGPVRHAAPRPRLLRTVLGGLVALGDAVALTIASVAAAVLGMSPALAVAAPAAFLVVAAVSGQYRSTAGAAATAGAMIGWGVAGALVLGIGWGGTSPLAGLAWLAGSAAVLMLWRRWLGHLIAAWQADGHLLTRVAVIGSAPAAMAFVAAVERHGIQAGVRLSAICVDGDGQAGPVSKNLWPIGAAEGVRTLRLSDLLDGREDDIDAVVIGCPWGDGEAVRRLCLRLRDRPVDVWLLPEPGTPAALLRGVDLVPGGRVLPVALRPLAGWRGVIKRAEDLVLAIALLVFFLPVMALVALVVALDRSGPMLIRQQRFGYANVPFQVLKFRTMYFNPDDLSGARATVPGDTRVTRIGRFLRASSLDELPQLVNVLRGEMSLVGPRPHPVEMLVEGRYYHDAVPGYLARHRMKPGITGLAQINGFRGLVDTRQKAEARLYHDLRYIETWSIGLDLKILWATVFKGFVSPGAF